MKQHIICACNAAVCTWVSENCGNIAIAQWSGTEVLWHWSHHGVCCWVSVKSVWRNENTPMFCCRIYHWQVDCWNRSKVEITIHNSAKIALTLEDSKSLKAFGGLSRFKLYSFAGPVSTYPQRIKRTNVRYVRGKADTVLLSVPTVDISFHYMQGVSFFPSPRQRLARLQQT